MNYINVDTSLFDTKDFSKYKNDVQTALNNLKEKKCLGNEWIGWWNYPKNTGKALVKEILSWKKSLNFKYNCVVVIGIGGSYLGTRTVYSALSNFYQDEKDIDMVFLGNHMSEKEISQILNYIKNKDLIVNVISKSGTTTEPAVAFRIVRSLMEQKYGSDATQRIVATTDLAKGALRELSLKNGYKMFEVPSNIGGRYSVLSAVGLVPLALAGFNIEKLMEGADFYFDKINSNDSSSLDYAVARFIAFKELGKNIEILSYSDPHLSLLIEWWKQLFGESEGKSFNGLFPAGMCLTTDLHSLGQYVQDGVRSMMETFLSFKIVPSVKIPTSDNNLDALQYLESRSVQDVNHAAELATKLAHHDGGVPCLSIEVNDELSEYSLGAIFVFFEVSCALSAALLGVNPFDQPGVEAYKKNLFAILEKPGYEELSKSLKQRLNLD